MTTRVKKSLPLLIILVLSFFSIRPFFHPGFFPIHDHTQVIRVQQMAESLRDGQFPVRWVRDLGYGYGYPLFNFYAPLPYYLGAVFNLIGFNVLTAAKMMMVLGVILAGVLMYLLGKEFWGKPGGMIAALFYVYAPYHAVDIYVRGAVGEFWAMAFLPATFLGFYKLSDVSGLESGFKRLKWVVIASLSFAAVILSHNLTAVMVLPFLFVIGLILLFNSKNKKLSLIHYSLFIILTLALSAFYWLPALFEKNLTKVNQMLAQTKTWEHLVYWDQFWSSPWLFAGSAPGRADAMSFMVGKLHLVLSVLSLIITLWFWQKRKKTSFLILASSFLLFISLFISSQSSTFIWRNLRSLDVLQYPWRFLILASFISSFLAGSTTFLFQKKKIISFLITVIVASLLLIFNLRYFKPKEYFVTAASDYLREENLKWETSKISTEYLPKDFPVPISKNEVAWEKIKIVSGRVKVSNLLSKSQRLEFNLQLDTDSEIIINTAFFPGWHLKVNNKEIDYFLDGNKPRLSLSPGNYQISAYLTNTTIRIIANLISAIALVVILGGIYLKRSGLFSKS